LFKNILFISVSISSSDLSLLSMLELLIAVIKELRIELESELELDSVLSKVSIVSELELELIKISIRILRVVSIFSLIYQ
jgi:hypothetical protein